jgi:hypothetical protein
MNVPRRKHVALVNSIARQPMLAVSCKAQRFDAELCIVSSHSRLVVCATLPNSRRESGSTCHLIPLPALPHIHAIRYNNIATGNLSLRGPIALRGLIKQARPFIGFRCSVANFRYVDGAPAARSTVRAALLGGLAASPGVACFCFPSGQCPLQMLELTSRKTGES